MLIPKDRVRWIDPDGGACSQEGVILSIEDDIAMITTDAGGEVEAPLHELVPLVRSDGTPFVSVHVHVWICQGEPTVVTGRTAEEADTDLWLKLEDHYRGMVGRGPGEVRRTNIERYFRTADKTDRGEFLYSFIRYI